MSGKSSVAVVGGGLVGASAALALARAGFSVTLVDRERPRPACGQLGIDIRNVALSPASAALLDELGAWAGLRRAPYQRMFVWEQWGDGQLEFDAAEVGRTELGWLVEASAVACAAWSRLEAADAVSTRLDTIEAVTAGADEVALSFAAHEPRSFDFLIAADGAQSMVRRSLGLRVIERPLDQVAIATVVRTEQSHAHTAWQRFLSDGPLAFLPSPDEHVCSVVWSQSRAAAERRMALGDDAFKTEIAHAIEHRLGAVTEVDRRFAFPLTQQRVESCAPHPRVLLIGDAMRVVHPLAGLGVNLGLEDVRALEQVARAHADLTVPGIWRRFARQRQLRSQMMIETLQMLQRLYGGTSPALSLLRNLGVRSFNALEPVKRQVMREAMGLGQLSGTLG